VAQENANVLHAGLQTVVQPPGNHPFAAVAATGIDLSTLRLIAPGVFRFSLVVAIADTELLVTMASGPDLGSFTRDANWRRVAGDTTQRAFEVLTEGEIPWSIAFWRIPPIGPVVPFTPP